MKNVKTVRVLLASLTFICILNAKAQFGMVSGSGLGNTKQSGSDISAVYNGGTPYYGIVWHDYRVSNSNLGIYAQCYNYSGTAQWTSNGLAICTATGNQLAPKIVGDGSSFFIAWEDFRNGNSDIYIQKVDINGTIAWTGNGGNGLEVAKFSGTQSNIEMKMIGTTGDVLVTWEDNRNGNKDIYGQRINGSTGAGAWTTNGVSIASANNDQQKQKLYENGNSQIMVVWEDVATLDVYGQLINYSGVPQWTAYTGNQVCTTASGKTSPQVVASGNDFFVSWIDDRSSLLNPYYAIMDDATGTAGTEVLACGSANTATRFISMISDRSSGVYIAWDDYRNGTDYDAYVTRIGNTGAAVWSGGERQVTNSSLHVWEPRMVTCDDEMIVVYAVPALSNGYDLYYNKFVTSNGNFSSGFSLAGTSLDTRTGNQWKHRVTIMQSKLVTSYDDNNYPGNDYDVTSAEVSLTCSTNVTTTSLVVQDPATSIDPTTVAEYKLYPNPVLKELTIIHPTEKHISKITIMSIDGRVVREIENFEVGQTIDVSGLAVGQYIIRIPDSNNTLTFKIVKQ
jgi:hypothetical protein